MDEGDDEAGRKRIARSLAALALGFMSLVSLTIFLTGDPLTGVDYVFLIGAPVAMSVFFYFVGLHHDSGASD